ncbi:MAG: response regulator [Planctomycetales bacterium]
MMHDSADESRDAIGRPMEILLVEDSLTAARVTMGALRKSRIPHRLAWFTDGSEALEFLHREGKYVRAPRPDLVLLDLELPGRHGRDILADLKADDDLRRIPVVVLTASLAEEDVAAVDRSDVDGYLTKPVDIGQFLELVRKLNRFWHADLILPGAAGQ